MARPPLTKEAYEASIAITAPGIIVGRFKGLLYPIKAKCATCGTKWTEKQAVYLRRGKNRCPTCHGRRLNAGTGTNSGLQILEKGRRYYERYLKRYTAIRLAESYKGAIARTKHRCSKGHRFLRSPTLVTDRRIDHCPMCTPKRHGRFSNIAIKWLEEVAQKKRGIYSTRGQQR